MALEQDLVRKLFKKQNSLFLFLFFFSLFPSIWSNCHGGVYKRKLLHSSPRWRRLDSQQILSSLIVTYVYTLQPEEV